MTTIQNVQSRSAHIAIGRLPLATGAAAIAAAAANVLVFSVEKSVLGIPFLVPFGPPGSALQPMPAGMVVAASVVGAVGAAILLALLSRYVARPERAFKVIAAVFLVLSLGAPLTLPVEISTRLGLAALHFVAGAVITSVLLRLGRRN